MEKDAMPRDFSFEEAAAVVICMTVAMICGIGGVMLVVTLM
jgi:hypothetical protein